VTGIKYARIRFKGKFLILKVLGKRGNFMTDKDFNGFHYQIFLNRLNMVSIMLIITYPLFFVVDYFFMDIVGHSVFRMNLAAIHFIGFAVSLFYVWFYRYRNPKNHQILVLFYVITYLSLGAAASLNSQLLTGNITAYLLILIAVAVIFPLVPNVSGGIFLGIHLVFVWGLAILHTGSHASLLMKQINSTGTMVIAFFISYTLYSYQKKDFLNQSKIRANEESFYRLFNMNPTPLILVNTQTYQIELMNRQALDYYEMEEVAQLNGGFLFDSHEELLEIMKRVQDGEAVENMVKQLQTSSHSTRWAMLNFEMVDYLDTRCLLIGISDITDLKQAEKELFKHATIDELTGVMNRRAGLERLHQLLLNQEEFVVCFIDVNHLKQVNDQKGHTAGDELLKLVSQILKGHTGASGTLFRLGGDEFILLFHHKTIAEVETIWEQIKHEMQTISEGTHQQIPISASHGLYYYQPGDAVTVEEILEIADLEMYREKFRDRVS
jgi:diguanylate cyclase (GGDEF)-like protein